MDILIDPNEWKLFKAFTHYREKRLETCSKLFITNDNRDYIKEQYDEWYLRNYPENHKLLNEM